MSFRNRREAGKKLARALLKYKRHDPVVLALPRGGLPVAAEVAAELHAPLDLILVRKIGVPSQPELAMGAVADAGTPVVARNEDVIRLCGIDEKEFSVALDRQVQEIARRRRLYLLDRPIADLNGRIAIVIDDGIATGATISAAIEAVRTRNPAKIVLATPVAPTESLGALREKADEVIVLESHVQFGAIGFYYADFDQVSDEEVIETLKQFRGRGPSSPAERAPHTRG
jgi:predicted phosphoribosyltransferase